MAECILAVALAEFAALLNSHAHKKLHCIFVGLSQDSVFVVAQDNNPGFCPVGVEQFIRFNCEDTHGGDGTRSSLFAKSSVVCKGYFVVRVQIFEGSLLACKQGDKAEQEWVRPPADCLGCGRWG